MSSTDMNKVKLLESIAQSMSFRAKKDQIKGLVLNLRPLSHRLDAVILLPFEQSKNEESLSDKWRYNGFVIRTYGRLVIVDPGYDFLSRFYNAELNLSNVSAVILSHEHLDHSASFIPVIDALKRFNKGSKIDCICPESFYKKHQLEFVDYADFLNIITLTGSEVSVSEYAFLKLVHSCDDTFGFKLNIKGRMVGYISDTGYAKLVDINGSVSMPQEVLARNAMYIPQIVQKHEYIKSFYSDCNVLISNINDLHYNRHSMYHMSGWDLRDIIAGLRLDVLVLQHIDPRNNINTHYAGLYEQFFGDLAKITYIPGTAKKVVEL